MKAPNKFQQFCDWVLSLFKKKSDYTVLSTEQRDDVRALLNQILIALMGQRSTKAQRAAEFMQIQRTAGEIHKTFDAKIEFLNRVLKNVSK